MIKINQELQNKGTVRGFAGIIEKQVIPLNENEKFIKAFKNVKSLKFLINPSNGKYAALITITKGNISVKSIKNQPPENISKKNVGWNGFFSCNTQIFLALALNRLSILGLLKKLLTRKVKVRGILKLLRLWKIFTLLR